MNGGGGRQAYGDHHSEEQDLDRQHQTEGVVDKLRPAVHSVPGKINTRDGEGSSKMLENNSHIFPGNAAITAAINP